MNRGGAISTVIFALCLAPGTAAHAERSATEVAKAHYALGCAHLDRGEYADAAREFEAGYRLKPLPLFLYNIAQVERLGGHAPEALTYYERYLAAEPNAIERPEVEHWITLLRTSLENERVRAARALAQVAAPPPPAPRPHDAHKRLWIALGVAGGALVVGGVATAIALSLGSNSTGVPSGFNNWGTADGRH
jgi:tetratricopeptide (TPR) repeat protein